MFKKQTRYWIDDDISSHPTLERIELDKHVLRSCYTSVEEIALKESRTRIGLAPAS